MKFKFVTYDDTELFVKISTGSHREREAAFTEIYNRYSPRIHAYCYRVTGSFEQAQDIFQETFIRFYKTVETGEKIGNVPAFLLTIARNLSLNHKRDKKEFVDIEEFHFPSSEMERSIEKNELLDLINRSLDLLDFEYREAFVLREYDGLSYTEISEVTGATVTNAKARVFRAKEKIRQILAPYLKDLNSTITE